MPRDLTPEEQSAWVEDVKAQRMEYVNILRDKSITHTMSRESCGQGIEYGVRGVCSCGWKGGWHYAWSDSQYRDLQGNEDMHRKHVAGIGDAFLNAPIDRDRLLRVVGKAEATA